MEVRNLFKSYGENPVLTGLNAEFPDGEFTALMGASGAGKTTLLRLLMGLERPDSGEIIGVPQRISAVFQEDRLPENFSAVAAVKMVTGRKVPEAEIIKELNAVGLQGHTDRPVRKLSGGMRRRVAVVRAILADHEAIFLDEALTGLDDGNREAMLDYILRKSKGKTLVAVTHNGDEAARFGNVVRL
jgi:NitT/TauT family transport system ATP-binding protein